LRLLIEAESLLNDGTAAVAFVAVLGVLAGAHPGPLAIAWSLIVTIAGGLLVGSAVAAALMLLRGARRTISLKSPSPRSPPTVHSLSLSTITCRACSPRWRRLSRWKFPHVFLDYKRGPACVGPFWEYVAFVVNSLIFLLLGARKHSNTSRSYGRLRHSPSFWSPSAGDCDLSAMRRVLAHTAQGRTSLPARALLGRLAWCTSLGAGARSAYRASAPRRHRDDNLCRRCLFHLRTRVDHFPLLRVLGLLSAT